MASTDPASLAAGIRWDLSDLYAAPDDPAIETDLDRALTQSRSFAVVGESWVLEIAPTEHFF